MPHNTQYKNFYSNLRRWRDVDVTCMACKLRMKLKNFQKHMASHHGIDLLRQCAFCNGNFEWHLGNKTSTHVSKHLASCLKLLCRRQRHKLSTPPPPPPRIDDTCVDSLERGFERHMDGREKHAEWTDFYEDVGQEPDFLKHLHVPHHVRFTKESGLGHEMHAIFHAYQQQQFVWYHAIVKAEAWSAFKTYIVSQPYVYFLPYWTLCDGKKEKDAMVSEAQRHHRHMILLVKKSRQKDFAKLWRQRVKLNHVDAKWHKQIESPFHLMNVLFYVSTPRAQCDGNPKHCEAGYEGHPTSHYWIRRQMYLHAKMAMAGLFENGYKDWVRRRVCKQNVSTWYAHLTRKRRKWRVRIEHLNLSPHGCVLPLERDMCLSHVVTLPENEVPEGPFLYHYKPNTYWVLEEQGAEHPSYRAWWHHQQEKGHCFVEVLEPCQYELSPRHANSANQITRVVKHVQSMYEEEKRGLNKQIKGLEEQMVREHTSMERTKQEYAETLKRIEQTHRATLKAIEEAVTKLDDLQQQLEEVNCSLQDTVHEKVLVVIAGLGNAKQQLQEDLF